MQPSLSLPYLRSDDKTNHKARWVSVCTLTAGLFLVPTLHKKVNVKLINPYLRSPY